jgi:Tyrosyl-DNA phosphodiesterase
MGHQRLQQIVSEQNIAKLPNRVLCQCSSLGNPDLNWLSQLNGSLRGSATPVDLKRNELWFLYPSKRRVMESRYPETGGQFFYFSKGDYPNKMLRDCISRNNALMHSKIILCCDPFFKKKVYICSKDDNATGFMYTGSHNMSKGVFT